MDPSVISSFFHQHPSLLEIPPFSRKPRLANLPHCASREAPPQALAAQSKLFSAILRMSQPILAKQPGTLPAVRSKQRTPLPSNKAAGAGKQLLSQSVDQRAQVARGRAEQKDEPETCATSLRAITEERVARFSRELRLPSRTKQGRAKQPRFFFAKSVVPPASRPQDSAEAKRRLLAAYLERDSVRVKLR